MYCQSSQHSDVILLEPYVSGPNTESIPPHVNRGAGSHRVEGCAATESSAVAGHQLGPWKGEVLSHSRWKAWYPPAISARVFT